MRLTQRLLLGFGVLFAMLIAFGAVITALANRTLADFNQLNQVTQPISIAAFGMEASAIDIGVHVEEYLRTDTREARRSMLADMAQFEQDLFRYQSLSDEPAQRETAEQIAQLFAEYRRFALLRVGTHDVQAVLSRSLIRNLEQITRDADLLGSRSERASAQGVLLNNFEEATLRLSVKINEYLASPNPLTNMQVSTALARFRSQLGGLEPLRPVLTGSASFDRILRLSAWSILDIGNVVRLQDEIVSHTSRFFDVRAQLESLLTDQVQARTAEQRQQAFANATGSANSTRTAVIALLAAVLLVGGATTVLVTRSISQSVQLLKTGADKIGSGELSYRIPVESRDELGELAAAFNDMAAKAQDNINHLDMARREAENANRMKDLFLATMSHELRTPLNAMIGFLHLMLFSGQLSQDNEHMANRSLANSQRLLTLINNILDLSRIATGAIQIVPSQVHLRDLSAAIYNDMKPMAEDKGLTLNVEVDPALPSRLHHDSDRIMQIVTNLVHNAIKFTEKGHVDLTFSRQQDRLLIRVADTGIGIPKSKQGLIFDDFFQVDPTSTRQHQGAGLGLAIVKRLVLMMEGTISLSSDVQQGSVFTIDLPLNLPAREIELREPVTGVFSRVDDVSEIAAPAAP